MKVIIYLNFILTLIIIGFLSWKEITFTSLPVSLLPSVIPAVMPTVLPIVLPTVLPTPKEIIKEVTKIITITPAPVNPKMETTYLPITGSITTTSTSWYDAPGTEFYLNTADYGKSPYLTWEASLKIAHGNGTAFARLFDVTHGIAVNGSEVEVVNKADLTQTYSGSLNFWANNNLYRVQLKSLNTFEVTFGGGRIKIIY